MRTLTAIAIGCLGAGLAVGAAAVVANLYREEPSCTRPKGQTATIVDTVERVLAKDPERPGARMPGAGHLVHMPFRNHFRLGRYLDAVDANRDAMAADRACLALARPEGIYPQAYHPDNRHSLEVEGVHL
jgi:hypothetical protein